MESSLAPTTLLSGSWALSPEVWHLFSFASLSHTDSFSLWLGGKHTAWPGMTLVQVAPLTSCCWYSHWLQKNIWQKPLNTYPSIGNQRQNVVMRYAKTYIVNYRCAHLEMEYKFIHAIDLNSEQKFNKIWINLSAWYLRTMFCSCSNFRHWPDRISKVQKKKLFLERCYDSVTHMYSTTKWTCLCAHWSCR